MEREVFGRDGDGVKDCHSATGSLEDEVEDDDDDDNDDGGVPLPSTSANPSTPPLHPLPSTSTPLTPQQRGLQKAREREMVRQAARRGVAFGFEVEIEEGKVAVKGEGQGKEDRERRKVEGKVARRKVECIQGGRVVESSFAKGEWGVRWRV